MLKDILLLKQALPYLRQHKGRIMVVKLGGEIAANVDALDSLASDVSLLVHVGIRCVVVHGGGPQATELSRRLGLQPEMVQGRRVTDEQTLDVAKMVFAGKINIDIISAFRRHGVRGVGMSGVAADIIHASRRAPTEITDEDTGHKRVVDFGHVGDVTSVNTDVLSLLMSEGYVPVLSSLGSDAEGNILNINADTVSSVIAQDLAANKLISLTGAPGLLFDKDDPSTLVPLLTVAQARRVVDRGWLRGGMRPKVQTLVEAVEGGVPRAHILSGREEGALLLELFTRDGAGTVIVATNDADAALAPTTLPWESQGQSKQGAEA